MVRKRYFWTKNQTIFYILIDNIEKTDFLDILKKLGIFCKLVVSRYFF